MTIRPVLSALLEPFREPKRLVARAACFGALILFWANAEVGNFWGMFEAVVILGAAWGINHRAGVVTFAIVRAEDLNALRGMEGDEDIEAFLRECAEECRAADEFEPARGIRGGKGR